MAMLRKIELAEIKLNMMFSAPVFFEDGKNMFLAAGKMVKQYHLAALKKWKVPFLLSSGKAIEQGEGSNIERMAGFDKKRLAEADGAQADSEDIEELEEIEEAEEVEDAEPLEEI